MNHKFKIGSNVIILEGKRKGQLGYIQKRRYFDFNNMMYYNVAFLGVSYVVPYSQDELKSL